MNKFTLFGLSILGFFVLIQNSEACGSYSLILNSPLSGDIAKMSCGNDGYIKINPTGQNVDISGLEISSEKVVLKKGVDGDAFLKDKYTAKSQVFVKNGSDIITFKCKNPSSISPDAPDISFTKISGNSTELEWDTAYICLKNAPKRKTIYFFTKYPNDPGRPFVLDNDANLVTGIDPNLAFDKTDWDVPRKVKVYFPKDSVNTTSSSKTPFELIYRVPTPTSYSSSFFVKQYDVKNVLEADISTNKFDIVLDYRYDVDNQVTPVIRSELRSVADEFQNIIKPNSKTITGEAIQTTFLGGYPQDYQVSSSDNPVIKTDNNVPIPVGTWITTFDFLHGDTPTTSRKFHNIEYTSHSITIFVTKCYEKTMNPNALEFINVTKKFASANYLPNYGLNLAGYTSVSNPPFGQICVNTDNDPTNPQSYFNVASATLRKNIFKHEIMHALGSVDNYATFRSTPVLKQTISGQRYFIGPSAKSANNNSNLLMDPGTNHLGTGQFPGKSVMEPVISDSTYNGIYPIDKAMLEDNGYCIVGLNPCN